MQVINFSYASYLFIQSFLLGLLKAVRFQDYYNFMCSLGV